MFEKSYGYNGSLDEASVEYADLGEHKRNNINFNDMYDSNNLYSREYANDSNYLRVDEYSDKPAPIFYEDEDIFYRGLDELKSVPYAKITGDIGFKEKQDENEDDKAVSLGTNFGATVCVELRDGKFSFSPLFMGMRVEVNATGACEKIPDNMVGGTYKAQVNSGVFIDKDGVSLKSKFENDFDLNVNYQKVVSMNQKDAMEGIIIAHNRDYKFCDFANINVKLGFNRQAAYRAINFISENQDSIKRGAEKVVTKRMSVLHEKTGKALKEYIEMPNIID